MKDSLTLDFSGYEDLLKEFKELAREDFRTPEQECMWLIRYAVRRVNGEEDIGGLQTPLK